jgi:N-acetyltransferase
MKVEPVVLEGHAVRLEPLRMYHLDGLCEAGLVDSLWRWTSNVIRGREDMERYVGTALDEQSRGVSLPFATIDGSDGRVVGSTRFGNIDPRNRRAEIGWTWLSPLAQRTGINTEAKLLMLTHAFDVWDCVRVELKTDALNEQSRKAILRLGAKEEGTLRRHLITDAGRVRDTVYFSIVDHQWQEVRTDLAAKLRRQV